MKRAIPCRRMALLALLACTIPVIPDVQAQPARACAPDTPLDGPIARASARFALPDALIRAVIAVESNFMVYAVSPKGARGLMQITPGTWEELRQRYALGADPFDPCDNIFAGSAYLRELLDRYGDPGFLGAYNAGPGRYESYLNGTRPLPSETIDYMARVSARMGENTVQSPARAAPDPDAWRAGDLF
ncbi:MAG: lytic transglycosylase domain-containing protein, partial [Sphingomonas sp.]